MTLRAAWEAAARVVAEHRDVLDARPGFEAGDGSTARGWGTYLERLDDGALERHEIAGIEAAWSGDVPASLRELARAARAVCDVAVFAETLPTGGAGEARRHESPRKQAQIDAFARVLLPLAKGARRVVDVGSGHGHLTREIAERLGRPVIGLERDVALAQRARALAAESDPGGTHASFSTSDVVRDGLALEEGDCVIGLHACGELGDAIVTSAARSGTAVALVGCCLQKRSALAREPLCDASAFGDALVLPRALLGLSNLTPRDVGVEASRAENLAARERRLALHRLLSEHDPLLSRGAEIDGLNRRTAHRDLRELVARAFEWRGHPAPSEAAIDAAAAWARVAHARERRHSLPRSLLARALEVLVALDRALYLEERGWDARVGVLFPAEVSARNLAVIATTNRPARASSR